MTSFAATTRPTILVVEDDQVFARLLGVLIDMDGRGKFATEFAPTFAHAVEALARATPAVIILDLTLPDGAGIDMLRKTQELAPAAAIVIVTGRDDDALAIRAVLAGAQDYLVKGGLNGPLLLRSIEYARVRKGLEIERTSLIERLREAVSRVRSLEGLLPICSNCKRIRGTDGTWEQVETYIGMRTAATFSHGLCQPCGKALYGDLADAPSPEVRDDV